MLGLQNTKCSFVPQLHTYLLQNTRNWIYHVFTIAET
jgi:hypothetical protein